MVLIAGDFFTFGVWHFYKILCKNCRYCQHCHHSCQERQELAKWDCSVLSVHEEILLVFIS